MNIKNQSVFLLLIYFLITFGYTFSLGFYYLPGFILLLIAFLLLSAFYFFPKLFENFKLQNYSFESLLTFAAILSIALSLVLYGGLYQEKGALFNLSLLLLAFSLLLSLSYLFQPSNSPTPESPISSSTLQYPLTLLSKYRFLIFLTIAFLLRLFMLISSPNPQIDVFDILKNGPRALLEGKNPYSVTFNKIYSDVPASYFAYPPGALLFAAPFSIVLDDPRFIYILAEIIVAVLFFSLTKNQALSIIWLFSPRALFALEQAWLDTLVAALLFLVFYLWEKARKENLALLTFGVVLTIKQSLVFLPLLIFRQIGLEPKRWLTIVATAALVILPFFLWNKAHFIEKTIIRYFVSLEERQPLLHRSLTLNSFWFEQFQRDLPKTLLIGATSVLFILILWKQKKGWSQFFLSTTLFYCGLFLFSKMAFLNFYYFIGQLILINIAILKAKENTS